MPAFLWFSEKNTIILGGGAGRVEVIIINIWNQQENNKGIDIIE
jgi:hypothetical protein